MILKRCSKCGIEKPLECFYKNKAYRDRHTSFCKECYIANQRKYTKKYKEKIAAYQCKYRKEHKEKQRKYQNEHKKEIAASQRKYSRTEAGKLAKRRTHHKRRARIKWAKEKLTIEQWNAIIKAQGTKCNTCKRNFTKIKRPPTIDHIIPISQGGSLSADNIQALCLSCNSRKEAKMDMQYIQMWNHNGKRER